MDNLLSEITLLLSGKGFKSKKVTFNREVKDNIVQVVNVQFGERSLDGFVTVNLGVWIPCVYEAAREEAGTGFYQEAHCEIGERLGRLAKPSQKDVGGFVFGEMNNGGMVPVLSHKRRGIAGLVGVKKFDYSWYDRSCGDALVGGLIATQFSEFGERFLDSFSSHAKIIRYYESHGVLPLRAMKNPEGSMLLVGIILANDGHKEEAVEIIRRARDQSEGHPLYEHISNIASRIGLTL